MGVSLFYGGVARNCLLVNETDAKWYSSISAQSNLFSEIQNVSCRDLGDSGEASVYM